MENLSVNLSSRLTRWSTYHALVILSGTGLCYVTGNLWPLSVLSLLSFGFLYLILRRDWQSYHGFGIANVLTGIRLLAFLLIAIFYLETDNRLIFLIGLAILVADGLDGKIARWKNQESPLGEYLDKETDALFLHFLGLIAVFKDLLWDWVVVLGLLRYIFVVYLLLSGERTKTERRSPLGRYIFVYVIVALLVAFLPVQNLAQPAIVLAALLLVYSFGRDFLWLLSGK